MDDNLSRMSFGIPSSRISFTLFSGFSFSSNETNSIATAPLHDSPIMVYGPLGWISFSGCECKMDKKKASL